MTDYADVKYKRSTITLSGATNLTEAEGDIWYQSGKFYFGSSVTFAGVWSSGGNLGTGASGFVGCGTQSAGLCYGGDTNLADSNTNRTEEYNGTAWSAGGNVSTAVNNTTGCGTLSAGLKMGGYSTNVTEEYDAGPGSYTELFTGHGDL